MRSPLISVDEYETTLEEVIKYYNKHCIYRVSPEYSPTPFHKKGGLLSRRPGTNNGKWCMYVRRLTQNPAMLKKVSRLMLSNICVSLNDENPKRQLAGIETGSIPIMMGIGLEALECGIDLNTFTVKKKRKPSGIWNYIEGKPNRNPVILIEDNINSGQSMYTAAAAVIKELFLPVTEQAFCILLHDRESREKEITYRNLNLKLNAHSLICLKDVDLVYSPEKYWLPRDCMVGQRGPGISMDNLD
jgi:orotate phosphoribosyltransferase